MIIEINVTNSEKVQNENEVLRLRLESLEKKYNNEIRRNLHLSRLLDSYREVKLPKKQGIFDRIKNFKL